MRHHLEPVVLFDLGNTLVRLDLERGLGHLHRLAGRPVPTELETAKAYFSEASLACNRGELSGPEFLDALATQLGAPQLPRPALAEAWCDIFTPWPEMESLAARLIDAGHRAFLLSNTDPVHFGWLSPRMPVLGRLDGLFLSYEAGFIKPDPAFFTEALARFGLDPHGCLFLDDRADNVEAARSVGLRAFQIRGDAQEAERYLLAEGVCLAADDAGPVAAAQKS